MATETIERDEIGEIVENCTIRGDAAEIQLVLGNALYVFELPNAPFLAQCAQRVNRKLLARYPIIDIQAIYSMPHPSRVRGVPVPRFMPYSTKSRGSEWNLHLSFWRSHVTTSSTPDVWSPDTKQIWENRFHESRRWWWTRDSMRLSCRFAGLVPPSVKQKVRHAEEHFDRIDIVQEVPEWNATVMRNADPLVIGTKNGVAYLIDRFDTTTFEEYVAREFSQEA